MDKKLWSYTKRFVLIHVLVYFIIGSIFYELSGYEEALATMEYFELWRPLESLTMVGVVFFGQIVRGAIIALVIYPFYEGFMGKKHGWLLLFLLFFGLKVLAAQTFMLNSIEVMVMATSLTEIIGTLKVGIPEIIAQTLIFSVVFFRWERRVLARGKG